MHTTPRRGFVPTLVFLALVVSLVSSLGAPLIPTIAQDYGVSLTSAQWSLTLALLVGAIGTPVLGRLGDGRHRRRAVLIAVAGVLVGSLLATLPLGFAALLAGRAMQGFGLGLVPMAMSLARDHVPGEHGRRTVALLSVSAVAGVGLGYPVTGIVAEVGGLHGAFAFGALLSGLALAAAWWVLPHEPGRITHPLDVRGAGLLGLGFSGLLLALAEGERWGWASPRTLVLTLVSALLLAGFVVLSNRVAHPLVDLHLLRHKGVLLADVTGLLSGVVMYLLLSMVIRLVQTPTSTGYGIGASVVVGGLVLLPMSALSFSAGRLVPFLTRRLRTEWLLPLGTVTFGVGALVFALGRGSLWQLFVVMGIVGLGVGLTVSVMPALILGTVPAEETGSATGFNQVLRTAGFSAGSALSATVLEAATRDGARFPDASGYQTGAYVALGLCIAILCVVVPLVLRTRPEDRDLAVPDVVTEPVADALAGVSASR